MSAIDIEAFEVAMEPPLIVTQPESESLKYDYDEQGNRTEAKPLEPLSILTFDEISEVPIDENDCILGEHLLDKGSSLVIAGSGGAGKSRFILQGIAAMKAGHEKFLGFDIHPGARPMKWLVLQTENSVRRLKFERERLKKWINNDDAWQRFNNDVHVLTPLNEFDTMLNLDNPDNVLRIRAAIELYLPDGIIADPLGDYAVDDLNKDVHMRSTIISLSRLCRYGNPKRALVILHHALTGQAGAAKATGYDRTSFARNSKVLFNWTRAQINLAPMNEDTNDQLAVTCGKCSDGKEFQSFGVTLDTQTLIYNLDASLDVVSWAREIRGGPETPIIESQGVQKLCQPAMTRLELAKTIMDKTGCVKQTAYRHIAKALYQNKIKEVDDRLFKA